MINNDNDEMIFFFHRIVAIVKACPQPLIKKCTRVVTQCKTSFRNTII